MLTERPKALHDRHHLHTELRRTDAHRPRGGDCTLHNYRGDAGSIRDIEQADLVVLAGTNTAESHPVIASRIKAEQKLRGQKLLVVDVRKHEMAERADLFLRPHPSTDLVWASALSRHTSPGHSAAPRDGRPPRRRPRMPAHGSQEL